MNRHRRLRAISIALSVAGAAASLAPASCIKQKDSLMVVAMTAEVNIPGPLQVHVTVGPVTQTFDLAAGLSATTPTQRGVYLDSDTTGFLTVNATTQAGTSPCVKYGASLPQTVKISAAGDVKAASLTLVATGTCGGNGAGGSSGAGGNSGNGTPSLATSTCHEFVHSAGTDCTVST